MYLPFSALLGIAIYKRPSLLLYLALLHALLDVAYSYNAARGNAVESPKTFIVAAPAVVNSPPVKPASASLKQQQQRGC